MVPLVCVTLNHVSAVSCHTGCEVNGRSWPLWNSFPRDLSFLFRPAQLVGGHGMESHEEQLTSSTLPLTRYLKPLNESQDHLEVEKVPLLDGRSCQITCKKILLSNFLFSVLKHIIN